jgi:prepilin-type N-terminal cleavage/methylation domain-containing protein
MKTVANKFVSSTFPGDAATNPKPEIRNPRIAAWSPRGFTPKEARSPKSETRGDGTGFDSSFGFRNSFGFRLSDFGFLQVPPRHAFTLIELLVVIAIMGVLAALLFPVVGAVKKRQYINHTQAEMAKLETAIDRYKAAYGFYPPSPASPPTAGDPSSYANQLYYELVGTTNNNGVYQTLDGSAQIKDVDVPTAFPGVGGFVNCNKPGGGEDASAARNFLPDLRPNQMGTFNPHNVWVTNLISSVGGPDANYQPLGSPDVNPWRYNSSNPANNPGAYELWIKLSIGGKTNLICNWTKQVQVMTNNWLP